MLTSVSEDWIRFQHNPGKQGSLLHPSQPENSLKKQLQRWRGPFKGRNSINERAAHEGAVVTRQHGVAATKLQCKKATIAPSHIRDALLHRTSALLGSGSMDKFRTSNCETVTFPPHSPPPTVPTIIAAWMHQRLRIHLLWEMTSMSWSHHSCCICHVRFMGINCYSKAPSSFGAQCQFMSSCTRQYLQISSLSQFPAHYKKEEKAWSIFILSEPPGYCFKITSYVLSY